MRRTVKLRRTAPDDAHSTYHDDGCDHVVSKTSPHWSSFQQRHTLMGVSPNADDSAVFKEDFGVRLSQRISERTGRNSTSAPGALGKQQMNAKSRSSGPHTHLKPATYVSSGSQSARQPMSRRSSSCSVDANTIQSIQGRRHLSDLGLKATSASEAGGVDVSMRRTNQLLNNPSFRKHLNWMMEGEEECDDKDQGYPVGRPEGRPFKQSMSASCLFQSSILGHESRGADHVSSPQHDSNTGGCNHVSFNLGPTDNLQANSEDRTGWPVSDVVPPLNLDFLHDDSNVGMSTTLPHSARSLSSSTSRSTRFRLPSFTEYRSSARHGSYSARRSAVIAEEHCEKDSSRPAKGGDVDTSVQYSFIDRDCEIASAKSANQCLTQQIENNSTCKCTPTQSPRVDSAGDNLSSHAPPVSHIHTPSHKESLNSPQTVNITAKDKCSTINKTAAKDMQKEKCRSENSIKDESNIKTEDHKGEILKTTHNSIDKPRDKLENTGDELQKLQDRFLQACERTYCGEHHSYNANQDNIDHTRHKTPSTSICVEQSQTRKQRLETQGPGEAKDPSVARDFTDDSENGKKYVYKSKRRTRNKSKTCDSRVVDCKQDYYHHLVCETSAGDERGSEHISDKLLAAKLARDMCRKTRSSGQGANNSAEDVHNGVNQRNNVLESKGKLHHSDVHVSPTVHGMMFHEELSSQKSYHSTSKQDEHHYGIIGNSHKNKNDAQNSIVNSRTTSHGVKVDDNTHQLLSSHHQRSKSQKHPSSHSNHLPDDHELRDNLDKRSNQLMHRANSLPRKGNISLAHSKVNQVKSEGFVSSKGSMSARDPVTPVRPPRRKRAAKLAQLKAVSDESQLELLRGEIIRILPQANGPQKVTEESFVSQCMSDHEGSIIDLTIPEVTLNVPTDDSGNAGKDDVISSTELERLQAQKRYRREYRKKKRRSKSEGLRPPKQNHIIDVLAGRKDNTDSQLFKTSLKVSDSQDSYLLHSNHRRRSSISTIGALRQDRSNGNKVESGDIPSGLKRAQSISNLHQRTKSMDKFDANTTILDDDALFYYSTNVRRRVKKDRAEQKRIQSQSMENVVPIDNRGEAQNVTLDGGLCRGVQMRRNSIRIQTHPRSVNDIHRRPISMNDLTTDKLLHTEMGNEIQRSELSLGVGSDSENDDCKMANIKLQPPDGFSDPILSSANSIESTSDLGLEEEDDIQRDLPIFNQNMYNLDSIAVSRSTSDVSEKRAEEQRKKATRDKRVKTYKSDPFHGVHNQTEKRLKSVHGKIEDHRPPSDTLLRKHRYSAQSSKEDILTFLKDVQCSKISDPKYQSYQGLESLCEDNLQVDDEFSESLTVDTTHRRASWIQQHVQLSDICTDCGRLLSCTDIPNDLGDDLQNDLEQEGDLEMLVEICKKCFLLRMERKQAVQELIDTELSYGKDLHIIKEEFYTPMRTAGLLTVEQLQLVFSNLDELITINDRFADQLLDALESSVNSGKMDYCDVPVGELFLQSTNMLLAFETYCVNQSNVPNLLKQLERDKDLLRVFLRVSQTENSVVRRMDLKAFLMIPVQRVMKYPLLLSRVFKNTPIGHEDKNRLKEAQMKVEEILEHINSRSKDSVIMKLKRKLSALRKTVEIPENIELHKCALEILGWNRNDVTFIITGRLWLLQNVDNSWNKKYTSLKYTSVHGFLIAQGKGASYDASANLNRLLFAQNTDVQQAALVLFKEKAQKYILLRDPLLLQRCVVSQSMNHSDAFDIAELNKNHFTFKGDDVTHTNLWLNHLKYQTKDLGKWRRRRNAHPNIMIQHNRTSKPT